ncbi:hypothetical protein [Iamia sp.]|uniref:hypothetical protein n=1 Tax=Iamia sp. TaxID=2722710 RepID=UPI002C06EA7B|nr:hypothetical protein [Iamia sp.]HXH58165.1 hypothetical protein [Iamia sp.]
MRTVIRVESANCSWCMNAVRDELLARPLVHHVQMSAMAGCWEVVHDHDDPSALVDLLQQSLHGWQVASNGEIVQVTTSPVVAGECSWHSASADAAAPCEHGSGPGPSASRDATG